jgi:replicative DNA helicase
MSEDPCNREAEQAVLGALILKGEMLQLGLEPRHFYFDQHKLVYEAMQQLARVDVVLLDQHLRGSVSRAEIDFLAACCPNAGHVQQYAAIVRGHHELRLYRKAALRVLELVEERDLDRLQVACRWFADRAEPVAEVVDLQQVKEARGAA